jgi:hypothetical protein
LSKTFFGSVNGFGVLGTLGPAIRRLAVSCCGVAQYKSTDRDHSMPATCRAASMCAVTSAESSAALTPAAAASAADRTTPRSTRYEITTED